jgi:hypothetical protein
LKLFIHTVTQAVTGGTKRKRTDASSDFKIEFQRSLRDLSYLAEDLVNYYYPQKMAAFFKSTGVMRACWSPKACREATAETIMWPATCLP